MRPRRVFAILVTVYFWWENIKGIPESSEKALRIMYVTTVMVVIMIVWCAYTLWIARRAPAAAAAPVEPCLLRRRARLAEDTRRCRTPSGSLGILIGLGHSVLAMSGEETMAQVYREIEHPKLKNLEKAGFVIFVYSLIFTAGVAFCRGDDHSRFGAEQLLRQPDRRPGDVPRRARCRCGSPSARSSPSSAR